MSKFSVEEVSPIERRIQVEVEPEAVNSELNRAYKVLNSRVRIPGFRPGKVPRRILEARFRDQIEADVIQHLVEHSYQEAVEQSPELNPVSSPRVTNEELKPGEPFRYQAHVEVKPKLDPQGYESIELKKPKAEVTEAEVDEEIEKLREAMSEMVPAEGRETAQKGDFATVDFEGKVDGEAFPGGKGEDATVEIAEGEFVEGKVQALEGAKIGETRELDYTFPEDHRVKELAGKSAHFTMTLKGLKERKLPEVNDELAKNVGAGETVAELRTRLREEMEKRAKSQAEQQTREQLLNGLIERNPFEVPSAMVDRAIGRMIQSTFERLQSQGLDPRRMQLDFERLHESLKEPAIKEVKGALLMEAVAEKEKIEATDADFDAKIKELAEQLKTPEERIRVQLLGAEGERGIRLRIREEKTLAFLESKAKITES